MRLTPELPPLEVYMLGLVDFSEVQQLQRRLVYELGEQPGAVLVLCEHPPTISVGRSGSRVHIAPDDDELRAMDIKVHWVNRGGGCVFHLPGQLAAYLALPLETFGLSLQDYLDRLHTAILLVMEEFDLTGTLRPDLPGVFSGEMRIATVGVAVTRWIAYHGLTLNVGPYLELFDVLDEPGIGKAPDALHLHGGTSTAPHGDVEGARGLGAASGRGLWPGTSSRLFAAPPDSPEGRLACLCSHTRVTAAACRACRSWELTSPFRTIRLRRRARAISGECADCQTGSSGRSRRPVAYRSRAA